MEETNKKLVDKENLQEMQFSSPSFFRPLYDDLPSNADFESYNNRQDFLKKTNKPPKDVKPENLKVIWPRNNYEILL